MVEWRSKVFQNAAREGSFMQYFWPSLSDHWSWKPFCGLFESVRFTQILLYTTTEWMRLFLHFKTFWCCVWNLVWNLSDTLTCTLQLIGHISNTRDCITKLYAINTGHIQPRILLRVLSWQHLVICHIVWKLYLNPLYRGNHLTSTFETVKTQMKCSIMLNFIRVYTVC